MPTIRSALLATALLAAGPPPAHAADPAVACALGEFRGLVGGKHAIDAHLGIAPDGAVHGT